MKQLSPKYDLFLKTFTCFGAFKILLLFLFVFSLYRLNAAPKPKPIISVGEDNHLKYIADSLGNRVPDFSYCGYKQSEENIPFVDAEVFIAHQKEDATAIIQQAIDYVASLKPDRNGFRGAVLLDKGTFSLSGRLVINNSGIVLRGQGFGEEGTALIAAGKDRQTFIRVLGEKNITLGEEHEISAQYIPVNANYIIIEKASKYKVGALILIKRYSTMKWVLELGMKQYGGDDTGYIGWKPGQRDITWERKVDRINGDTIFFDVPLTTALDRKFDKTTVTKYEWKGRIKNSGVENLSLISEYDINNLKDEDHCHTAISIENSEDIWVRQVTFTHFAGSAVAVYETARCATIQDCISLEPVSEIANWRRRTFFTSGQQTLFQRIYSEYGYHDFATGFMAAGPNAFVECESYQSNNFSGAIDSWASGVLFDIVKIDGHKLSFANRYIDNQGTGWTAANSMFWQCSAARIENFAPPTAMNWAFGAWAQFVGNGYWYEQNSHINPRSLYYAQLSDRLKKSPAKYINAYMPAPSAATSSPQVEEAIALSKEAYKPTVQLKDWIMEAPLRNAIDVSTKEVKRFELPKVKMEAVAKREIIINNGWLVCNGQVMAGMRSSMPWWRGVARPYQAVKEQPAITRYVPGRNGLGYTDNLNEVMDWLDTNHILGLEHHYGLWYDRRRMDHERVRRMDADCWAPFYVQPFARSGKGTAWDGLSKYDLTKFDYFYWSRLKEFADLADQRGKILVHNHYFQHNILEAGAHWADSPWRPVNNINKTGFPDPPPYAGDKRIFIAEQFYDETDSVRRVLHQTYIRQCMDNFKDNNSVIQLISDEYTGPTHFVEFWLDEINDWKKETGGKGIVGLSTTKDVQDAVLNQKDRAEVVDLIDIRYWCYRPDSSIYSPKGGVQLAPRQHARLEKTGSRSFNSVYRAVMEYKSQFPQKAVIFSEGRFNIFGWAVFMAGGSLPVLPEQLSSDFLKSASTMTPDFTSQNPEKSSILKNENGDYIIYCAPKEGIQLNEAKGSFEVRYIDVKTGVEMKTSVVKADGKLIVSNIFDSHKIIWIRKK